MNKYDNTLMKLQDQYHKNCLFNSDEFNTEYYFNENGSFIFHFFCNEKYQGYDEMIHGGILSALIDSAMTKCLFGHGIKAYTARLNIKYLKPVKINKKITIVVNIKNNKSEIVTLLNASLLQNDHKTVSANAKFWIIKGNK
jgi:acyl-coenzyme A thioesterase PaaI-like protein